MKLKLKDTSIFDQSSSLRGFEYLTGDTVQNVRFRNDDDELYEPFPEAKFVIFELEEYGELELPVTQEVEIVEQNCLVVFDENGSRFEIYLYPEVPLNLIPKPQRQAG